MISFIFFNQSDENTSVLLVSMETKVTGFSLRSFASNSFGFIDSSYRLFFTGFYRVSKNSLWKIQFWSPFYWFFFFCFSKSSFANATFVFIESISFAERRNPFCFLFIFFFFEFRNCVGFYYIVFTRPHCRVTGVLPVIGHLIGRFPLTPRHGFDRGSSFLCSLSIYLVFLKIILFSPAPAAHLASQWATGSTPGLVFTCFFCFFYRKKGK